MARLQKHGKTGEDTEESGTVALSTTDHDHGGVGRARSTGAAGTATGGRLAVGKMAAVVAVLVRLAIVAVVVVDFLVAALVVAVVFIVSLIVAVVLIVTLIVAIMFVVALIAAVIFMVTLVTAVVFIVTLIAAVIFMVTLVAAVVLIVALIVVAGGRSRLGTAGLGERSLGAMLAIARGDKGAVVAVAHHLLVALLAVVAFGMVALVIVVAEEVLGALIVDALFDYAFAVVADNLPIAVITPAAGGVVAVVVALVDDELAPVLVFIAGLGPAVLVVADDALALAVLAVAGVLGRAVAAVADNLLLVPLGLRADLGGDGLGLGGDVGRGRAVHDGRRAGRDGVHMVLDLGLYLGLGAADVDGAELAAGAAAREGSGCTTAGLLVIAGAGNGAATRSGLSHILCGRISAVALIVVGGKVLVRAAGSAQVQGHERRLGNHLKVGKVGPVTGTADEVELANGLGHRHERGSGGGSSAVLWHLDGCHDGPADAGGENNGHLHLGRFLNQRYCLGLENEGRGCSA